MNWFKNHKVVLAMMLAALVIGAVGIGFVFADWNGNKMTVLALTPIWIGLPLALFIERIYTKLKKVRKK